MKVLRLLVILTGLSWFIPKSAGEDAAVAVDQLLNARGKVYPEPMISKIVALGDVAVPVITNRLEFAQNRMAVHWATVCLCRINTDHALKPVTNILHDRSHDLLMTAANQAPPNSSASLWCLRVTTAIQNYPTNRDADIIPDLIRLSDPAFGGMVHYYATERLRETLRRQPKSAGTIIEALDDRPEREQYSWNLGEILANESGHANHWGVFGGPSTPQTLVAQRNSIWRDWWTRNQDRSNEEWKAESKVISATIPKRDSSTNTRP